MTPNRMRILVARLLIAVGNVWPLALTRIPCLHSIVAPMSKLLHLRRWQKQIPMKHATEQKEPPAQSTLLYRSLRPEHSMSMPVQYSASSLSWWVSHGCSDAHWTSPVDRGAVPAASACLRISAGNKIVN